MLKLQYIKTKLTVDGIMLVFCRSM